jgi:hypothetical protein
MLYQYAVLAYSPHAEEPATFPLALISVPSPCGEFQVAAFVVDGWSQLVNESHRSYIEETLRDLTSSLRSTREGMFAQMIDLSVGPIRTLKHGQCDKEELQRLCGITLRPAHLRIA